jgi:hypothetical protein
METLASALVQQGNLEGAIGALELASRHKRKAVSVMNGVYWERNQILLSGLYRKAGLIADAQSLEEELKKSLAVADHDHPILIALRQREASLIQASAALAHPLR